MRALGFLLLVGCSGVVNGTVHDEAELPLDGAQIVRVPEKAVVDMDGAGDHIAVELAKHLGFHGHPPRPVSILEARRLMGVATRKVDDVLEIATFGEWDSHIEGGAWLTAHMHVPPSVRVLRGTDLEGETSKAQGFHRADAGNDDDPFTYWYAPTKPALGWAVFVGS